MDLYVANERSFHFPPKITIDVARDRMEQKKASLVAGTVGALISRPKPGEIELVSTEKRLEAFWQISVYARTAYDRRRSFSVEVSAPEVRSVTTLNQDLEVTVPKKGKPKITLDAVEHFVEELRESYMFDGEGNRVDLSEYDKHAKVEIEDLGNFAGENMLVVPPQAQATTVMRAVLADVIKPVKADEILEERLNVEALELYFHPIYAFEYEWAAKSKRVVVEFDALTGKSKSGGKRFGDQIQGLIKSDVLFDITADAAGLVVPGGSIAVRLVQAVVDRGK